MLAKGVAFKNNNTHRMSNERRRPNHKSMYEFTRMFQWKAMIQNKIKIHFRHPKPIANNQKPYSDDKWHALKDKHKLDKMLFSILDSKRNDDFYFKKLRLNSSNKDPHVGFKWALDKWIQSGTSKDNVAEAILLDTHYKYDKVENKAGLLDVIGKESCVSLLMDDSTRIIIIIYTTHNTKDIMIVWKGLDWESFLLGHLQL
jgi:hypothetical protein